MAEKESTTLETSLLEGNIAIIPTRLLEKNDQNILISEGLKKDLETFQRITEKTNKEIGFVIFGKEENGNIVLDKAIPVGKAKINYELDFEAFKDSLVKGVSNLNPKDLIGNVAVICHGNTHSKRQNGDELFSKDIENLIAIENNFPLDDKKIKTLGVVLTPNKDTNFFSYENEVINKYNNVYFNGEEVQSYSENPNIERRRMM